MKPMNQKQIPTSKNQIPNNMKPMKQKLILSSKSSFLAVFLLLPVSSYAAVTVAAWTGAPTSAGDKKYTYLPPSVPGADADLITFASVDASESGPIHIFNLSNLADVPVNNVLRYTIEVTDLTNFFWINQVSENTAFGSNTVGSVTKVFSDAWVTQLNSTTLTGTQSGPILATGSGLQQIWVETTMTGVSGANRLANITFSLSQTSAIPEVTSSFSLLAMLSSGLLLRRRTKS
jgi:hypothetical protein